MREAWIETTEANLNGANLASPPVREAWIETRKRRMGYRPHMSPPVREAWIETTTELTMSDNRQVASRAGGVD